MAYAIFGAGGHGRQVASLLQRAGEGDVVFIDDAVQGPVNGLPVIDFEMLASAEHRGRKILVSVADGRVRRSIVERCEAASLQFGSAAAPTHIRYASDVIIGEGAIFSEQTVLTQNIRIGRHFQCNLFSYVEHDCVIGDFVTFAPRVNCNGAVVIGDGVYVGTGAFLKQGVRIGAGAVVGMGAVVLADVPAGATVVGNPGRIR